MGRGEGSVMRNLKIYIVHLKYLLKMINFRSLRLAGHVARIEEDRRTFKILAGKPKERDH